MLTHTRMNISNRKSSGPFRFLVEPVILGTVILLAVMILTPLKVDAIRCDYYKDPECRNNPFDVHNKNCTSQEVNCSPEEPFCHASFAVLLLNGINRTVLATKGCWSPQDSAPCKSGMQSYCTNTKPPVPNPAKPELGPTYFCCCDGPLCNQRLEINKAFGEADSILPYITMKQYKQYLLDGPKQIVAAESTGTITSDQNTASVPSLPSPIMQPVRNAAIHSAPAFPFVGAAGGPSLPPMSFSRPAPIPVYREDKEAEARARNSQSRNGTKPVAQLQLSGGLEAKPSEIANQKDISGQHSNFWLLVSGTAAAVIFFAFALTVTIAAILDC
ncbi:uncharacterized protein LOC129590260 isoform X1 [Paramacrobiotus metropolitanus]|uniref:uncharacterized protein LOC129590260 isoform X1 n=1 Tax=Paramacrobiotus metropolitanus TaxID=2943436 RepID=UPI002445FD0C|nr:uncharacterized protein LOC129590260 isoform X1 [Paramacrobiotus metropolitanus]